MIITVFKTPFTDATGKIQGIIGNSLDITDLKNTQLALLTEKEKAESVIRTKIISEQKLQEKSLVLQDVLNQLQQRRYYLTGKFKDIYLTKREAECILCLARGFTNKQMAAILGISDRTIDNVFENLRPN